MIFLQKAFVFLKHYWYIPLSIMLAILFAVATRDKKPVVDLVKMLTDKSNDHKAEVAVIEKAHQQQIEANNKAEKRMFEVQRQVREEYERNEKVLDEATAKRVKEITKKLKNDPHAMADEIEKVTNMRVIVID